jgi:SPIRAL1-like protein
VTTGKPIQSQKRDHNARSEDVAHGFRAKGSNAHANGANQNCGNFITDRPTSKVISAPGGSSSFGAGLTFGGNDTSVERSVTTGKPIQSQKRDHNATSNPAPLSDVSNKSAELTHGFRAKGSNAHANGANQNCGNFITDRPTSRVLAPPGGVSSIFG